MTGKVQPKIVNSDAVIINRYAELTNGERKKIEGDVRDINPKTKVIFTDNAKNDKLLNLFGIENKKETLINGIKLNLKVFLGFLLCIGLVVIFLVPSAYTVVQSFSVVFLGILMQAIPFLLIGSFLSVVIQLYVPSGWILSRFSKGGFLSFLAAAFAGLFLPMCDCGTVPVVAGLLRKNTPLPQVITFWLASSAVNPLVIVSMLYAFPDQPMLALVRFISGVLIAVFVGLLLQAFKIKTQYILKSTNRYVKIGSDIGEQSIEGVKGNCKAVLHGARKEFFRVMEYITIGAFISALLQAILPQAAQSFLNKTIIVQFIIMILAAMLMSTCSTSNAFIGRSFSKQFSTIPILSFVILGPMLDLQNLIMLSGTLKKWFLLLMTGMVIITSLIMLGILSIFI